LLATHFGGFESDCVTLIGTLNRWPEPTTCVEESRIEEAVRTAGEVCERLTKVAADLPARLAERLGFRPEAPPADWVVTLFHLGWHFPGAGIDAGRYRIRSAVGIRTDAWCSEMNLQLDGLSDSTDVFPGVIVSRLASETDFLSASANGLQLLLDAVERVTGVTNSKPRTEFATLRDKFARLGEAFDSQSRSLSARILGLTDSFHTPPAAEWAGVNRNGDGWGVPKYFVLSHLNADRVVCELFGSALDTFLELADHAGSLLPTWPAQAYPALSGRRGCIRPLLRS
jgi:hypothetical protein